MILTIVLAILIILALMTIAKLILPNKPWQWLLIEVDEFGRWHQFPDDPDTRVRGQIPSQE